MISIDNIKYKDIVYSVALATLLKFGIDYKKIDLEIVFLGNQEMQLLNNQSRGKDCPTDVLSFPSIGIRLPFNEQDYKDGINPENGCVILGEIAICEDIAKEQAAEYGHSLAREVAFLACHGILHLLGFDHKEDAEQEEMQNITNEILGNIGLDRQVADSVASGLAADFINSHTIEHKKFKSGFVALIGRPNSGKSTLVNTLVGEKVSIVSYKPQTTRNKIMGILTKDNFQLVFVDTPGLQKPKNKLGEYMSRSAESATKDIDVLLYLVDGEKGLSNLDKQNIEAYISRGQQLIVVLNKIDHITKERAAEILTAINEIKGYVAVVPLSALTGKNTQALLQEILPLIKEDYMYYDKDMYTDKSKRFLAAEIIREKTLRLLNEEIPHGVGVDITKFEPRQDKDIIDIDAEIYIEKPQHKPIILGKDGQMMKKIATYAREDLEVMTQSKVFLSLWVKVKKDWRDNLGALNALGYRDRDI